MKKTKNLTLKTKRIIGVISLLLTIGIFYLIAHFAVFRFLSPETTASDFKSFIDDYGFFGSFVALGIQILQVFIAFIPGEFIEVGLGYAFGAVKGTLICLAGVAIASTIIFALTKKWGVKLVELFVLDEKINSLSFIKDQEKLKRLVFLLFLIPGTPKDVLTYIVPLTRMKTAEFLCISLLARIPSVVSSTVGGHFFEDGKYIEGILLLTITGLISLLGLWVYNLITAKYRKLSERKGLEN